MVALNATFRVILPHEHNHLDRKVFRRLKIIAYGHFLLSPGEVIDALNKIRSETFLLRRK